MIPCGNFSRVTLPFSMHRERRRWFFDLEKSLFDGLKWARFVSFLLIGTELIYWANFPNYYCIIKCLIFKTERTVQIVTVGYFEKCDTFQLPYSRFCEAIISFEERKGYNFKELQFTSLYLKSKIEIEHCCFLPRWQTIARLLEVVTL